VVIVVIVPPVVVSHVPASIMSPSARETFAHRVWLSVGPDQLPTRQAIQETADPAPAPQEGPVLHDLQVVAQEEDVGALDVDWLIMMWRRWLLPVRLGDREHDLHWYGIGVTAPRPQVKGPRALTPACLLLQIVHSTAPS
jgi:hypothetical protein